MIYFFFRITPLEKISHENCFGASLSFPVLVNGKMLFSYYPSYNQKTFSLKPNYCANSPKAHPPRANSPKARYLLLTSILEFYSEALSTLFEIATFKNWSLRRFTYENLVTTSPSYKYKDLDDFVSKKLHQLYLSIQLVGATGGVYKIQGRNHWKMMIYYY